MGIFRKNKRQFGIRSHRNLFVALFLCLIFGVSATVSFILNVIAADVPVPSVEIFSEHSSYPDGEPGSWKITKSAEWVDFGKARVTFKVESVAKYSSNKLDVVMVVDNSGSMSGVKMSQVKADATDLTNTLLSDSDNKMALVTFNSTAEILSGFTNNKTSMIDMINGINIDGSTNYNQGLIKTLEVLDGYSEQNNRDLVILFLTDGFPNMETLNEIAQYQTIKTLYPNSTVNGIQYEMGEEILEPIIRVSDKQYIANTDSLHNVLFEAAVTPYIYDDFVITDFINNDYWTLSDANKDGVINVMDVVQDVSATIGTYGDGIAYNFPDAGVGEQIQWDISGLYRSGETATLTIDLDLKEQYLGVVDDSLLFPTNTHETIVSSLEDTADEDIDSPLTPKLRAVYDVVYDANEPNGCTVPDDMIPENSAHVVYSTVEISDTVLACPGYSFKGWSITTDGVNMINEDYFRMPGKDVIIKASWGKPDISKSMDGEMHMRATATFDKGTNVNAKFKKLSGQSAGYDTQNTTIMSVKKVNSLSSSVDINDSKYIVSSADSMAPIYAWYDNGTIYYYTDAEEIYLNADATYMFNQFRALSSIEEAGEWNTSNVTSIRRIFYYAGYNSADFSVDISSWNTSNVTSMYEAFEYAGYSATTWSIGDLSGWNVSNVINMNSMFNCAGYSTTTWSIGDLSVWNVSNVTDMSRMFYKAGYNADNFSMNLTGWSMTNATNLSSMFENAGYNATTWSIGDLSGWNVSNVKNMSGMFRNAGFKATSWLIGDISGWDVSSVTNMSNMFKEAGFRATSWSISDLSGWNMSNVKSTESMFSNAFRSLPDFSLDLSGWNMSNVTNMNSMFFYAGYSATTWSIGDISGWNVSNAVDMTCMFSYSGYSATTWSIGDISGWDVSSVTTMSRMFEYAGYNASSVSLNLSGWNTSNVTNMSRMLGYIGYNASSVSLNLSGWNTSNVTDMSGMFRGMGFSASSVSLNLSGWDTSNVINMSNMFERAYHNVPNFSLDLSGWNTSNVTNMNGMFSSTGYYATSFSLNLSGWNTSNVTNMDLMFSSTGYKASTWEIIIPATNGAGISNTNSSWYGNSTSVSASLKSGRTFTLATP